LTARKYQWITLFMVLHIQDARNNNAVITARMNGDGFALKVGDTIR
jgi:hypothetical protein